MTKPTSKAEIVHLLINGNTGSTHVAYFTSCKYPVVLKKIFLPTCMVCHRPIILRDGGGSIELLDTECKEKLYFKVFVVEIRHTAWTAC